MPDTIKTTVTNGARGLRGLHTVNGFVELEPGQALSVELTEAEFESAESTGYFVFGDALSLPGPVDVDDLDTTEAKLREIAAAEGIDLSTVTGTGANGRVLKADVQAVIRAAREKSASADPLDDLDDATLIATVEAVTGKPAPAEADRETLLRLARGES